jgi:signal transduction histidine kinase
LTGIWGVARNITALANLNERLQRERERLKAYARQLVGAEERALRAAAVNLHDGTEKLLTGMKATLEAVASQAPAGLRRLLDDLRNTLSKAHHHTQQLIADLSPPGLYDLGLGAALQWLSVYMRGRSNLQVLLNINVTEGTLDLELRILAFQLSVSCCTT